MARFLPEAGLLIQHMPRTGGTWVSRAVMKCGIRQSNWINKQPSWLTKKHSLITHYRFTKMVKVRRIACFVRHPLAYYESVWKWMDRWMRPLKARQKGIIRGKRLSWAPRFCSVRWYQLDFNDWVFQMLQNEPMWYTRLVEQYVGPDGGEFCDFIGRTETLADDVRNLLEGVGYEKQVQEKWNQVEVGIKRNASGDRLVWDEELKRRMLETERLMTNRFYGENSTTRIYSKWRQEEIVRVAEGGAEGSLRVMPPREIV